MNANDMHEDVVINTVIEYINNDKFKIAVERIICSVDFSCGACIFNDGPNCIKRDYENKLKENLPEYYI